ncbi:transcriptional regulator GlxA family with amidase domain [Brevibacterium sanguinis]|uniref:Transcriptional regulator GlxA family with amidase domain n=2 Tax=Brevibacterium TaxID=1696 RepID=A0A366IHG1_9MICO|nr:MULTISPECIES: DJ-1/PfpI family protein [Brevibacterium]RBP63621.1 transcriptional regulator GlxA family with amidase domain [Brevibacterium sanguinis]RBP70280.1 transcriptional regulator GlxA family with amidase domain [Brevibacterium celere]
MAGRTVVVVGYDGVELLDVACVTSGFDHANRRGVSPRYDVVLASPIGRMIRSDSGLEVRAQTRLDAITGPIDTLIVSGGTGHEVASSDERLLALLRHAASLARRIASVCTGATILAAAGLLDGRRATTHWFYADDLARRFPAVLVDAAPIYVRDGPIATSGGVTAALDLTLAFIEEDHGAEITRQVALGLVTYLQRPADQAQMSMYLRRPRQADLTVRRMIDHVVAHLADDLSAAALADLLGVSERQLSRLCIEHLGRSPARFVRETRLDAVARLLTETSEPMTSIARSCGFASAESLRQTFVSRFGTSPTRYRATHRSASPAGTPVSAREPRT